METQQDLEMSQNLHTNQIDLITEFSHNKPSKYKKALFEFYLINSNSWIKLNLTKLLNILAYCGIGIKQLQFQSLVLLSTTKKSASSYDQSIENFLNNIRFDLIFIKYTSQNTVTFTFLSIVFILALMFILIYFQLIAKKRLFIRIFIIVFVALSWTIENYLMIPMVIYSSVYIQHALFVDNKFVDVYNKNLDFSPWIGLIFVVQLGLLFLIVVMNTLFNYTSGYSYETAYSRAHSIVSLKQIFLLFFLSVAHIALSKAYFLYICTVLGIYMVYNYLRYLAYYSQFDNLIDSGLWLTLFLSSTLSLINESMVQGFETVVCLLILLPFAYFLLWTSLEKSFAWQTNSKPGSPFAYELKIRKSCKNTDIDEDSIEKIRSLFDECTKQFIEYKLICIWECNFEIKYTGNSELAIIKLLKIVFANKKPDYLPKSLKVYKSFPDIEAQFLHYKLFKKLCRSSINKEFELLRHIKKYSKTNSLDIKACEKLVRVIDGNLNSKDIGTRKITKWTNELFLALNEKNVNLGKFLKHSEEESKAVEKYKTFKDQLFFSTNLKYESQEDKYIDRMIEINTEKNNAKMILSGLPSRIGVIIYVNKSCIDLLSAENSSQILGQNFKSFIVKPLQDTHNTVLEELILFGKKTEIKKDHLIFLNINGHAIEVSVTLKICYYAQAPYFLIDLIPKLPIENMILLTPIGEILSFSEKLSNIITPEIKHVDELFKNITNTMQNYPLNTIFLYSQNNQTEIFKVSELQVNNTVFKILYIYDEEFISNYYLNSELRASFKRKNSILNKIKTTEIQQLMKKPSFNIKRKPKTLETTSSAVLSKFSDKSSQITKICRVLVFSNFWINLLIAVVIIVLTVTEVNMANAEKLEKIVEDLGKIRGYISVICTDARSLDLLKYQEAVYYDSEYYKETLLSSSEGLKDILLGLDEYSSVFPIKKRLANVKIQVLSCLNQTCSLDYTNLYQGLFDLTSQVNIWIGSNTNSQDSLQYIYNNAYYVLFSELNNTLYMTLDDIHLSINNFYGFLIKIKSVVFIPLILLLLINLVSLLILRKINKGQWEYISGIPTITLLQIRKKTVNRLKTLVDSFIELNPEVDRCEALYDRFWVRYSMLYLFLVIFVILYCVLMIVVAEQSLSLLNIVKVNYTFWGGMRSSVTSTSFLWAREEFLINTSRSYYKLVPGYYRFPATKQVCYQYIDELLKADEYSTLEINELNSKGFDYSEYFNYTIGSPCEYLSIINCSESIVSKGLHLALNSYAQELKFLINSQYESDSQLLKNIEHDSSTIKSALKSSYSYLQDQSLSYYTYYTNFSIIICTLWVVLLLVCYKFLQRDSVIRMKNSLLSRNQLILLFHDTRITRVEEKFEESQCSQLSSFTNPK